MSLAKHSLLNLVGAVLPILAAVPSIGILTRVLEPERFAVVTLAWALVGYAGILELGMSRAVVRLVAASREDRGAHSELLSSALALVGVVGVIAASLLLLFARPLADHAMNVAPRLRDDCISGLGIVSLSLPLLMVTLVLQGYWDGLENFVEANIQRVLGGSLVPATTAVAAFFYPTFTGAMFGVLVSRLAVLALALFRGGLWRMLSVGAVRRTRIRGLVGFGSWLTVSNAIGPLMSYMDRYVLAYTRGASVVGYYAGPSEAALRLLLVPVAVTRSLFPKLTNEPRRQARSEFVRQSYGLIALTCVPIAIVVYAFAGRILQLWLGRPYAEQSTIVLKIMMVGYVASAFAQIPFTRIQALGRPDLTAKIHMLEVMPFLVALYWLSSDLGVTGSAIAWSSRNLVDLVLMELVARGASR